MMRLYLLSALMIFILDGCGQPKPTVVVQKCELPHLPTYRLPKSRSFTVKPIDANHSVIANTTLLELVRNNASLRRTCTKYAKINQRINREYGSKPVR